MTSSLSRTMMRAECLLRTSLPDHPWPNIKAEIMETDRNNDSGISPGRTSSEANSNSPQFTNSPQSPDQNGSRSESPERNRDSKVDQYSKPQDIYPFYYGKNRPYSPPHYRFLRQTHPEDTPKKLIIDEPNFSPNSESNNSRNEKMDNVSEKSNDYDCVGDYLNDSSEHQTEDSLERLKNALEKSSALSGIFKCKNEEGDINDPDNSQDNGKKEFSCILCAYKTPYRHRLMEHVATHYSDKCTLCDFKGQNIHEFRSHLQLVHNISDIQDLSDPQDNSDYQDDDDDDDTPNKRGKSKSFKCKQCNYVTTTKLDFWEHSKGHIKPEKLLTCPKCPFVTEYKHHLEYHLRNHFGSKPYKCTKCTYSCVNKSMLNSHLKSHSNVYQYRCSDCNYATKYCHSLKLHLRKYQHTPAMVLNADGSPNPLPIIDIYGTRRGPKQKPNKGGSGGCGDDEKSSFLEIKVPSKDKNVPNLPGGIIVPNAPQISPKSPSSRIYSINNNDIKDDSRNGTSPKFFYCSICEFHTISPEILNQHMYLHAETNLAHIFKTNNNLQDQNMIKDYLQNVFTAQTLEQTFIDNRSPSPLSLVSPKVHSPVLKQPVSPLDLSKQENYESENETAPEKKIKLEETEPKKEQENKFSGTKHRRKGKAYKLERIKERFDSSPDEFYNSKKEEETFKIKVPEFKSVKDPETPKPSESPKGENGKTEGGKESYSCDYCDIAFKDEILHTVHMGYHGYQHPFTCNMCGHETLDKVSFFLHVHRSSHS